MRVKLEWLKELVDLEGISLEAIVNNLSLYATEVEGVEKLVDASNLVVGHVLERVNHPDSDHLSVCQVDVGEEVLQIVCGAPNVDKGQYVIVALNGASLPNGIKIKKSKIRGVESNGMICSLAELGIEKKYVSEEDQVGIYVFKEPVVVGSDALKALNLHDEVIELGLTPNRSDLLSMLGVAIEVGAVFNRPLKPLAYKNIFSKEKSSDYLEVINETDLCLGYYGRVFKNIEIKPSPRWLISRLIAFGIRPINNVVDITNYILALFGQPLHAFDYEKLGKKIVVRKANKDEEIVTLDNEKRKLEAEDIVITDGIKPVAIAGVMGGLDTEITDTTKVIVLEAAVFNPASIRKTSLRLGLRSDSSIRFEKGVDLNRTKFALNYASYLLQEYANAEVLDGEVYAGNGHLEPVAIRITPEEVQKKLGIYISPLEIKDICRRLQFAVTDDLEIIVPTRRNDIKIKEDIIEELGRLYGYHHLPLTLPKSNIQGGLTEKQKIRREIKTILSNLGLTENITYSLINEEENKQFNFNLDSDAKSIQLLMPLSQDRKVLRKTIIPSLVNVANYCYSRKLKDLAIFELGKVYYHQDTYKEEEVLGLLLANEFSRTIGKEEKVDFYLVKGILEELFTKLGIEVKYVPLQKEVNELHPKRSAEVIFNGKTIGYIGALHPKYAASNDLDEVYVAEIKLTDIFNYQKPATVYHEVPKVPSVERDIAIVVDRNILAGDIIETIKGIKRSSLSDVNIFDVYTGEKIDSSKKSVAITLTFTSEETLTEEVINSKVEKILKELNTRFNATLRA